MKRDSKLSDVLHVLLHMLDARAPLTSEQLAAAMKTHPVHVRRTMAGLRELGLLRSTKGHGGGWELARDPARISLLEVQEALGGPELVAFGVRHESPGCLVEQVVNAALEDAAVEAQRLLRARLSALTLADLSKAFSARMRRHQARKDPSCTTQS